MEQLVKSIRLVDIENTDIAQFTACLADCVILTKGSRLLMQRRPENWGTHPGVVNIFGGHVEDGETPIDGLVRELNEELGAVVDKEHLTFVGAITEDFTGHTEIVHIYFWHDRNGTITGCYEAESLEFDTVEQALKHPKIMDYAVWALLECQRKGFVT